MVVGILTACGTRLHSRYAPAVIILALFNLRLKKLYAMIEAAAEALPDSWHVSFDGLDSNSGTPAGGPGPGPAPAL